MILIPRDERERMLHVLINEAEWGNNEKYGDTK